jgi:acyl-coenzyme A synthetase/AMP-(fatty) acid ligase
MNIVEPILFQAKFQPEAPALCAQGRDVVSYARLAAQMNSVARRAQALGLKRGDIAALSIDDQLLHAVVILGLTQAGIVPVSVAMQKPPTGLKIDAVISNLNYPFAIEARHLRADASWIVGGEAPVQVDPAGSAAGNEICRIVLTSGSTGEPRAVAHTHNLVMGKAGRCEQVLGGRFAGYSRIYMNIGLGSAPGYWFLVYILGRGGTAFFRGESIEHTLRSFEIFQIQAIATSPAMLAQLLAHCDLYPSIEVHVDTVTSAGGYFPRTLFERVRPRLCSHVVTRYGSTEMGFVAAAAADRIAHIEGAPGYVVPGAWVEIVDENDRPVPIGTEGTVRVRSEFGVDRYIGDPIESAKMFRNGWFYPGDLGSLTADNILIISGRAHDILNVGGAKLAAEKLELILTSFPGVSEAAVFVAANPHGVDEVWAAVVCRERFDPESLRAHCRLQIASHFVPSHLITFEALPITPTGKVDRQRVKQTAMATAQS